MKNYSKLPEISSRDRRIIGLLVLLVVFGALSISVFPAQFKNLYTVKKQLRYQTSLIKSREQKINRMLSIKKQYDVLMSDVEKTHNMFFNSKETADFLKGINDMAERETDNNLLMVQPLSEKNIGQLSPDNEDTRTDKFVYKEKIIRLTVEGSFRSIEDLIKRFDNYKKLLRIASIRIEERVRGAKIKAQLELAMYIEAEAEMEETQAVD